MAQDMYKTQAELMVGYMTLYNANNHLFHSALSAASCDVNFVIGYTDEAHKVLVAARLAVVDAMTAENLILVQTMMDVISSTKGGA